jgi:hypothetical protein
MYKRKGGAARGLTNDDYTILYNLGFDEGDIEMIEFYNQYASLNDIIAEFIRVANENYNANIDNIENIIQSDSQQLPNSIGTKRDVAKEVVYFYSNEGRINGGYRKRSRSIRSRRSKKPRSKRVRTRKNRKNKN